MKNSVKRKYNRNQFYKYMSAKTAKIVLINTTLRWSSPLEFNDPFDIPREILFGIDDSEITKAVSQYFIDLIKNPPEYISDFDPKIKPILEAMKNPRADESREEIIKRIQETNEVSKNSSSTEEIKAMWRSFIPELRILCLSESYETISMWYHYADKYKGVVLELDCNEELGSAWLLAEPVNYVVSIPEISSAIGWAKLLFKQKNIIHEILFRACTYSKTPDWSYEKEWRVTSFKRHFETGTISDYKFNAKEIKSIYLGPLIEQNDREEILQIVKDFLPYVSVYNCMIGMNRNFKFSKIV
jgi:hypothetical protein